VSPVSDSNREKRLGKALEKINNRHGRVLKRLAE
jgi:hypothetical protein